MTLSLLAANYDETLTTSQLAARVADSYLEAATANQVTVLLTSSYIEVLTPADLDTPTVFIGWGVPV